MREGFLLQKEVFTDPFQENLYVAGEGNRGGIGKYYKAYWLRMKRSTVIEDGIRGYFDRKAVLLLYTGNTV